MIGYTTLGTNDLRRARAFYTTIFEFMGIKWLFEDEHAIYWGRAAVGVKLAVTRPHDGQPASVGNGVMVALQARDRSEGDAGHAMALSLGAAACLTRPCATTQLG